MTYTRKKILQRVAVSIALLAVYAGSAGMAQAAPFSNVISDKELDKDRGAHVPEISNEAISDISASVTGGVDTNTVSGENIISSGALTGAQGFTTVIQNSGNNVNIQSSTLANVTFVNPVTR